MDILHWNGAALGAGNCLFGHKDNVARFCVRLSVFFDDIADIVLVGDDMGADCKTLIFNTVYLNDFIFSFIYDIAFFAHVFTILSKTESS